LAAEPEKGSRDCSTASDGEADHSFRYQRQGGGWWKNRSQGAALFETILGNKPSIKKVILLEYVKTPDGILVKEIEKRLGVSGLDKNHLTKLEEFGILEIHHIKVRRPAGRFKTETMCTDKGYRLKQYPDTFAKLLSIFVGTEHLEDFLHSSYVDNIELRDLGKIDQIVIDTIINKLKTVQLVCDTFYSGLPLTNELNTILASDGVAAKLSTQRRQQISDVALNLSREKNQSSLTVGRFMSDLRILVEQAASSAELSQPD
jgi:hypothetical protein